MSTVDLVYDVDCPNVAAARGTHERRASSRSPELSPSRPARPP